MAKLFSSTELKKHSQSLTNLKKEVDEICGGSPAKPKVNKEKVVAIIKWVDGTVLDSVFEIA